MITPATRSPVSALSLVAVLATTLALGACAHNPSPGTWDGTAATPERAALHFDNEADTYVDVYLVSEKREWWLGRVAPGAKKELRLPLLDESPGAVKLAVLSGERLTVQAARDPRATFTIAQPAASILAQQWTFSKMQTARPELFGLPAVRRQ
jgi:hypothetical protein